MIQSMLDTDTYKCSMGQAVLQLFPRAKAEYAFINRGGHKFDQRFMQDLRKGLGMLGCLQIEEREKEWMQQNLLFLTPAYIDFFSHYRFDVSEISLALVGDQLALTVMGPWYRSIYFEVPLMAIISEIYCKRYVAASNTDEINMKKATTLRKAGVGFADFGTRRRYSFANHDKVVGDMKKYARESFVGTSNMYLAMRHNLKAIGTQAHEWTQGMAAIYGYRYATEKALEHWVDVYQGDLGIALTDTFTTDVFLKSFGKKHAKLFDGVRCDSGDPCVFADKIIEHYTNLQIDPMTKTIVFSDGLDVSSVIAIEHHCAGRIKTSFGVGTNLANDVGITPMNIVIKMTALAPDGVHWVDTVKLSDDVGKNTGDSEAIDLCVKSLGL